MAITKSVDNIQDWTAVAQNTIAESATYDCSLIYEATLHIQAFLDTATAHTGTRFIVQISGANSGDEDWQNFTEFTALVGTANIEAITNNPLSAASTTITCASTTGYTVEGEWRAIEDGTLVNSELVLQKGYSSNTNITIVNGTTNEHAQSVNMYSIAMTQNILIPAGVRRVRVLVDNTYDADGSTLNYKARITKITGV